MALAESLAFPLGFAESEDENNIRKLLRAVIASIQEVEDQAQVLLAERTLDTATGAQLDVIGRIVGQPRLGRGDDTYRRYCRAKIAADRSCGRAEQVIRVALLVVDDPAATYVLNNTGTAAYELVVEHAVVTFDVALIALSFLEIATSAGVRVILETWPAAESAMFSFAPFGSDPGTGVGFGSTLDASVGGVLASALTS